MTNPVIKVQNLSKYYRLGVIGGGTLREDLSRWWARKRGKLDPYSKIGDESGPQPKSGQVWALKDINLEVNEGEILGIIGRNGAGKSTLLKILSRITAPTSGRAVIRGRVGSLLEVGTGFHPELTGRENIYLNGAILGMSRSEVTRKLEEIVEFAEVAKFVDTPVKRYSSGMLVRLAFAVAAHLEPEILIVDEVLAVGDASFQRKCLGKMKDVSTHGRTVLFVSHNMQTIEALCPNSMVVEDGRVVLSDSSTRCIQYYLESAQLGSHQNGEFVLSSRGDRQGEGRVRIQKVAFTGKRNCDWSGQIRTGDPVSINFQTEVQNPPSTYSVGIAFFTASGNFLCGLKSDSVREVFTESGPIGSHHCRIEKFPLSPGEYIFNVIVSGTQSTYDWIQEAGKIEVHAGDFYGTGKLPAASRQGVMIEQSWS